MLESELPRPRIAIDGVFFQIANTGIARVWRSLLQEWVKSGFAQNLLILDRAKTAPRIEGIKYHSISRYDFNAPGKASLELQAVCDLYQIDLFMSTYYTTPISTPAIFLLHDMIPEVIGADLSLPIWQEKNYAIQYASKFIAISQNTARDLCRFFPQIDNSRITLAYNGIDPLFTISQLTEIEAFRNTYDIKYPYFLIVGDRVGVNGYKNVAHFFRAMHKLPNFRQFEIVCVGGVNPLEIELVGESIGLRVRRLSLSDRELQAAYSGAIALVYPSRYEGFGLPVLEAMACGCPVITCHNSSLPEVAGDAALYVSDTDISDLVDALEKVQQPEIRQRLIQSGLSRSKQFSWTKMADTIAIEIMNTYSELEQGQLPQINPLWLIIRQIQSQANYAELMAAREKIASMESSKFWRLRQRWFQFKKKLGLVEDIE